MGKRTFGVAMAACVAWGMVGCSEYRDAEGGADVPPQEACAGCHGTQAPWAPAPDSRGNVERTFRGVGAHQAHLVGGVLGASVSCVTCHRIPDELDSVGHIDSALPAEVRFVGIAIARGLVPEVVANGTGETARVTCRNVACHGAGLDGGTNVEPTWNADNPSGQVVCGSCHGLGPATVRSGGAHPAGANCAMCHETVAADGSIARPDLHIDGKVQARGGTACNSCHGNAANAAPPVDLAGRSDTTLRTVGAHQAHLKGTTLAPALTCADCHLVPSELESPGHLDGTTQVVFGAWGRLDGATPTWDVATETCAGSYCHGATLDGGSVTAPKWTKVDGTQDACGTCHGMAPATLRSGGAHPAGANCANCHDTVGADGRIAKPAQHIDGVVQVTAGGTCNSCHGSTDNPAPPVDTLGRNDTALRSVGAHQAHLLALQCIGQPVVCTSCHVVPAAVDDAGHLDGTVQVVFGGLSVAGGAQPTWDGGTVTCANTYCHGATLDGGSRTAPLWTTVDGSQVACGSCHGLPPGGTHPANVPACGTCHEATATVDGGLRPGNATHIDGVVQHNASPQCNACHGGLDNDAPPRDLEGGTDTALMTVGAHQAHLRATRGVTVPLDCDACHIVPATWTSPGHMDTLRPAEVVFGDLSTTGGLAPSFDRVAGTCTNTYCHGADLVGGKHQTPIWNVVDGSQSSCDACHGLPPKTGKHPGNYEDHNGIAADCTWCHMGVTNTLGTAILDTLKHLDGKVDVAIRNGTWDAGTRTCDPMCHGPERW